MKKALSIFLITGGILSAWMASPPAGYPDLTCTYGSGLTPAEDQRIFMLQYHYMENKTSVGKMKEHMFPLGFAYGVTNSFSLMLVESVIYGSMKDGGMNEDSGMEHGIFYGDPLLTAKYKLFRFNGPSSTFGAAISLGAEFPAGNDTESTDTFNLLPGIAFTGRYGNLKADFNVTYSWNYIFLKHSGNHMNPADEINLTLTAYYQIPFGELSGYSLAPVFELSMVEIRGRVSGGHSEGDIHERDVYTGYGIKFSSYHLILDLLFRIPVYSRGERLYRDDLFILAGSSIMF